MPHNLFDPADRQSVLGRLTQLSPGAIREWGKMTVAQMLAHCSAALEVATGDKPRKQALIGRILGPFVKSSSLGEKPFSRNSPTDPKFVMTGDKDFEVEKARLLKLVGRFADGGPEKASGLVHPFFGRLDGAEWSALMYKHLDHHLHQFGP